MIKDVGSKYDDYSISPKIRQISLHWGYELPDIFLLLTQQIKNKKIKIKMSCYHFNRKEILQKAKERYSKEKAAGYYLQNKESIKVKKSIQKLVKRRKRQNKEYQRKRYQELIRYKKEALQNK